MVEVIENRIAFPNEPRLVYCYECKTEMSFNGRNYECPICGTTYG